MGPTLSSSPTSSKINILVLVLMIKSHDIFKITDFILLSYFLLQITRAGGRLALPAKPDFACRPYRLQILSFPLNAVQLQVTCFLVPGPSLTKCLAMSRLNILSNPEFQTHSSDLASTNLSCLTRDHQRRK